MKEPTTINELIAREKEKAQQQPQARERPVPCRRCWRTHTWNISGICNGCQNEN
jgi:hypothetical protein